MEKQKNPISKLNLEQLSKETDGYTASDITALAKDAALGPVRELPMDKVKNLNLDKMRKINMDDFNSSLKRIRKSVAASTLESYEKWNQEFGDTTM